MADPIPLPALPEIEITAPKEIPNSNPDPLDISKNSDLAPYRHEIESVGILSSQGKTTDVFNLLESLDLYQDLYSGIMSGTAVIDDNMDLIYEFKMCGNEFFAINFKVLQFGNNDNILRFTKVFRIYKISDRTQSGISGNKYTLHFCSDFQLLSDTTVINKAYLGMKNSEIVEDILAEYLKVPEDRIVVESTDDTFDHIISNMRPIEAINWLGARSYSKSTGSYCYFFYESVDSTKEPIKPKFYFKSSKSMFNNEPKASLNLSSNKLSLKGTEYALTITKMDIMDEFDILRSTMYGAFASRMTGIDIFNQKWNVYEKSLEDQKDNLMNKNLPINKLIERNDNTLLESYDALDLYYNEIKDNPTAKDNNIEFILERAQTLAALNNFRMKLVIQGTVFFTVGDIISIEFPVFRPTTAGGAKTYNEYRGTVDKKGKFLISAIRHTIKGDVFETILEICSDSFATELPAPKDIVDDQF